MKRREQNLVPLQKQHAKTSKYQINHYQISHKIILWSFHDCKQAHQLIHSFFFFKSLKFILQPLKSFNTSNCTLFQIIIILISNTCRQFSQSHCRNQSCDFDLGFYEFSICTSVFSTNDTAHHKSLQFIMERLSHAVTL